MTSMTIGRYTVVRELNQGGMARATLARGADGRLVVLKTALTHDPALSGRLRDEGRVGLLLKHPHLVETIESFEHEGRPVVAVEFIRGVSVGDLRKSGALGVQSVARIGRQIASALQAMHTARDASGAPLGIVHRDVSAANILIDTKGDATLIDLGIASFDGTRAAVTNTGDVVGTVRYLAPELLDDARGSPTSDVWSLGCVLVEAATGVPLFDGKTTDALTAIIRFTHYEGDGVDPRLLGVLRAMLTRDPKRRATTAEVLKLCTGIEADGGGGAADLADLVTATLNRTQRRARDTPTAPTPQGAAAGFILPQDPRPRSAVAPALVVGLLLGGAGFAAGSSLEPAHNNDTTGLTSSAPRRPGPDVLPVIVNVWSTDESCAAEARAWRALREAAAIPAAPIVNYPNRATDASTFANEHRLGHVMTEEVYDRIRSPPPIDHFTTLVVDRTGAVRFAGSPGDPDFATSLRAQWAIVAEEDRVADATGRPSPTPDRDDTEPSSLPPPTDVVPAPEP